MDIHKKKELTCWFCGEKCNCYYTLSRHILKAHRSRELVSPELQEALKERFGTDIGLERGDFKCSCGRTYEIIIDDMFAAHLMKAKVVDAQTYQLHGETDPKVPD